MPLIDDITCPRRSAPIVERDNATTDYIAIVEALRNELHAVAEPVSVDNAEVKKMRRELAKQADALDALLRDARRLDWIGRHMATVYASRDEEGTKAEHVLHWVCVDETKPNSRRGILGDTLRTAIDAAMKGTKP